MKILTNLLYLTFFLSGTFHVDSLLPGIIFNSVQLKVVAKRYIQDLENINLEQAQLKNEHTIARAARLELCKQFIQAKGTDQEAKLLKQALNKMDECKQFCSKLKDIAEEEKKIKRHLRLINSFIE